MRILPSQSPPQTAATLNSTFPLIITRLWRPANGCARTVRDSVFYGGHSRYQKEHLASRVACWWFAEWLQLFGRMLVIVRSHSQRKPGSLGTRSTPGAHVGVHAPPHWVARHSQSRDGRAMGRWCWWMQGTGFFSNSLDERDKRPGIIVKKLVTDVSLFKIIPRPEVRQHVAFTMSWKLTGAGSCDLATHAHGCQASGGLFPPGLTFPGINLSVPYLVSLCSARMFQKLSVLWSGR